VRREVDINPPAIIFHAVLFMFSPATATALALACVTVPVAAIVWALAPLQRRAVR
jgi:hypothetical protein